MSSEFEKLLNDDVDSTENEIESTNEKIESTNSSPKQTGKKPNKSNKILDPEKILDETKLWKTLVQHQNDFGFTQLINLLAKQNKNLKLDENTVLFSRTPAVNAIIKIFRLLNQEGFQ